MIFAYVDGDHQAGVWGWVAWTDPPLDQGPPDVQMFGRAHGRASKIQAAISCLRSFDPGPRVWVFTPSAYLWNGMTKWVEGWKNKSVWRTMEGFPVAHRPLWEQLDSLRYAHRDVLWIHMSEIDVAIQELMDAKVDEGEVEHEIGDVLAVASKLRSCEVQLSHNGRTLDHNALDLYLRERLFPEVLLARLGRQFRENPPLTLKGSPGWVPPSPVQLELDEAPPAKPNIAIEGKRPSIAIRSVLEAHRQELIDAYGSTTMASMARQIDVDPSSVRRFLIKLGVHKSESRNGSK